MRRNAKGHISFCNTGVGGLGKGEGEQRERERAQREGEMQSRFRLSRNTSSHLHGHARAYGHSFGFVILRCLISGELLAICPFFLLPLTTASSLYLLSDYLVHLIAHKSLLGSLSLSLLSFSLCIHLPVCNCNLARHLTFGGCARVVCLSPGSFARGSTPCHCALSPRFSCNYQATASRLHQHPPTATSQTVE